MIHSAFDSVTSQWLRRCSPVWSEAFDWIDRMPASPETGITELRGSCFYINVHGYDTLPVTECAWESHRHTVDIQYCISGGEIVEWMPPTELTRSGEYNPEKDAEKWLDRSGSRVSLAMKPGFYAIFLPNELHRPKIADGINTHIEKLVVKIDAELLGL